MTAIVENKPWYERSEAEERQLAATRRPDDPQLWMALAQAWMREGNFLRADAAYATALALDPSLAEAWRGRADALRHIAPAQSAEALAELRRLGGEPDAGARDQMGLPSVAHDATIYADITDLLNYLAHNSVLSGIQRVIGNLLRESARSGRAGTGGVMAVVPDFKAKLVYAADMELVLELIDAIEIHHAPRTHIDRLLERIRASLKLVEPEPRDILLIVGAFWMFPSYDLLKDLRDRGVIVSIFIHDLIPVSNREYVERGATEEFQRGLIDALETANFITTNSDFVAREVRRFLQEELALDIPVQPVPLATEMSLTPPDPDLEAELRARYPGGYVLCVCTIEKRKNHLYLARIWEELAASGRHDIPALVLVGKWDRKVEDFRAYLEDTGHLGGRIHILSGVSNSMLASLYRAALFTIYPSLAEGWGLPVGESLVLGKPCIASGVTSIPEVGGELVRYIDPLDVASGLAQVTRLLDDQQDLLAWEEAVKHRFRPRSWREFADELLQRTTRLATETPLSPPPAYARLIAGEMAVVGASDVAANAAAGRPLRTARMARAQGWHALGDEGAWTSLPTAGLRFFALGCPAGTHIRVILELRRSTEAGSMKCSIDAGLGPTPPTDLATGRRRYACDALVGEHGIVDVLVHVLGEPALREGQACYALLSRIGFHGDDAIERLTLMEQALIPA